MKKQDYEAFITSAIIIILLSIILFIHPQWQMEKRYRTYIIDEIESVSGEIESLYKLLPFTINVFILAGFQYNDTNY